jgi:hypothetical protein
MSIAILISHGVLYQSNIKAWEWQIMPLCLFCQKLSFIQSNWGFDVAHLKAMMIGYESFMIELVYMAIQWITTTKTLNACDNPYLV